MSESEERPQTRTLRNELLIVLGVSFAAAALYGYVQFVHDTLNVPVKVPVTVQYVPKKFDPYDFLSTVIGQLSALVPVALVAHLFGRTGEGMRRIGFDRSRLGPDVRFGSLLALAALVAMLGGNVAADALHLPFRPIDFTNANANAIAIVLALLASVVAALSEEVIVNGYLLTRLGDIGWSASRALVASALLRGSYHLYQGVGGFIYNVVGGLVAGRIFQRTKRIVPLVVAHLLIDVSAFVLAYFWPGRPMWLR